MILSSPNIIFLNNNKNDSFFDRMFIDYETPARKCFQYLKDNGAKKIAFLNGANEENGIKIGYRRAEGVRSIMEEEGVYNEELFMMGDLTDASGKEMMKKALSLGADAVVLGTQLIENGVLEEYEKSRKKPILILSRDIDLDHRKTNFPVLRMCSEQLWEITNLLIYSRLKRPSPPIKVYIQASFEAV